MEEDGKEGVVVTGREVEEEEEEDNGKEGAETTGKVGEEEEEEDNGMEGAETIGEVEEEEVVGKKIAIGKEEEEEVGKEVLGLVEIEIDYILMLGRSNMTWILI